MSSVFLDTVGLLALWDESDQWHEAAEGAFRRLKVQRPKLVTTTCILMQYGNAAARRPYRHAVICLHERMTEDELIVTPTEDDWRQAWIDYENDTVGQAGIVDHMSFVVMRRLGLTEAFTNDHHFRLAGFETLL